MRVIDLYNPQDLPNDGLVYANEAYFHDQNLSVQHLTVSGEPAAPTHSFYEIDHATMPFAEHGAMMAAAAMFNARRVYITLSNLTVLNDLERDAPFSLNQAGEPPAEVAVEYELRFEPFLPAVFGRNPVVAEQHISDRSPEVYSVVEGHTLATPIGVYQGPIFDGMNVLSLHLVIAEVDRYPRFEVRESLLDEGDPMLDQVITVPLVDGPTDIGNENVTATLRVHVVQLY